MEKKEKTAKKEPRGKNFERVAIKVSKVSIIGNVTLSLLKLLAGIFAHSSAMVSDAIHSASDVFSTIIVIIGVKLASKESDREHPYGHERLESVAAIVLSIVLAFTGIFIGYSAFGKLTSGKVEELMIPGIPALIAAVISILVKEAMYWYTKYYAKAINSGALMADAWHHRSDALSSIGSLVGIVGARMGFKWLDPFASLIICIFILKAAYDIFVDAIRKMVDRSCDEEVEEQIVNCAKEHPQALDVSSIHTRKFGNKIYVDLEVVADGGMTLRKSNEIAEEIHNSIEEEFKDVKHIAIVMKADA